MKHTGKFSFINQAAWLKSGGRNRYDGDCRGDRLAIVILIWTLLAALIPNVWLSLVDGLKPLPAVTNVVLPAGVYLLLLSLSRRIGFASLWFIILFVFASFQIVLLYMYGRSVIAVDMFLNVVTTNSTEMGELLGNLSHILIIIVAIYLPPIIMAIIAVIRKMRLSSPVLGRARFVSVLTIFAGLLLLGSCFLFGNGKYLLYCDLYPVNIAYNLREAVTRTAKVARYQDNVKDVVYPSSSERPDTLPETYILVVGETSRAINWQLNGYSRATSPRLMNEPGLVNFPKVLSQTNTTHKSVPLLLSHLDVDTFGDSIYFTKSLITEFKNAGYHTSFFTAQSPNHSFIDFFGEEADTCVFIRGAEQGKTAVYDSDLLRFVDDALASDARKKLIVLHTYGSHFNYIDRYPRSDAKFLPDGPAEATAEFRDKQINAYDNTILFTSNLLADLMDRLQNQGGVGALLYTSDHGEDIFDDSRKLFLHASPKPSYYQLHVPFMVWLSPAYRDLYADKFNSLKENQGELVASSEAFYHTALDLAGVISPYYNREEAVTTPYYRPGPLKYLNDHNHAVPLAESGLLRLDFARLDSLGLKY